ncbi:hypothetical protein BC941DRAFT_466341 [Chlamydoabsidia padenii]|nr:hypothetical protein BC941DRAFT_466341 [Chlamydoabsidia padenii]
MTDTLYHCLLDVTNSNTETTSLVSSTKDGSLSSQDDTEHIPSLSSPSTTSTLSSPSSSLIEVTLEVCEKRSNDITLPTSSILDAIDNKENSTDCHLKTVGMVTPIQHNDQQHQHVKESLNKLTDHSNQATGKTMIKVSPGSHSHNKSTSKRRKTHNHSQQEQQRHQDSTHIKDTKGSPDFLDIYTSPILAPVSRSTTTSSHVCLECQVSKSTLWRKGPDGHKTLCNACGLRYAKFCRGLRSTWKMTPSLKQRRSFNIDTDSTSSTSKKTTTSLAVAKVKKSTQNDGLCAKKVYLKAGMYSSGTNQFGKGTMARLNFTLPIHQGAIIMGKEKDFKLPLDIIQDYESGRLFGWADSSSSKKPPGYARILHNIFVERKPRKENDNAVCQCIPPKDGHGCGDDCLNRMMFFECDPSTCPCGDRCSNQKFKKRQFVKSLKVYLTDGRGWGIRTKDFIRQGTLITEYRGEIISDKTCQERIRTVYKHQKNFYFLDYHKGEVIDACSKGSEARFINHGCDPNCHIEKWSRRGEYHLGVFASQDIPAGSELFYDYNFSLFDTEAIGQECRCGSTNCRGFLGKRPGQTRK